jgi:undecaprenyl-diphosphatase
MSEIEVWQAVVLGVVEGITEYLPVSSTGHLTITEQLLGLDIKDEAITAYTAVIQIGAIFAALIYFFSDIARLVSAWVKGLFSSSARREPDYRFAWYVIVGSIPVGVVGFLAQDLIKGGLRSLWVVAAALILWSIPMAFAEYAATQIKGEQALTMKDSIIIGVAQCLSLIPGVSRSGATITAGLLRDLDRVTATRLSFLLGIPALTAAGLYELKDAISGPSVSTVALVVGTVISFVVAFAAIAWLLKYVAHHSIMVFVWYRVLLGFGIIALLVAGTITAY